MSILKLAIGTRTWPLFCSSNSGTINALGIRLFRTSEPSRYLFRKNWKELTYRKHDKIPANYSLIYRSSVDNYLRGCKHVSTFSLVFGFGLLMHRLLSKEEIPFNFDIQIGPLYTDETELYIFCGAFLLVNLIIRITLYRCPSRIYRSGTDYIAVFHEKIPFIRHRLMFQKGETTQLPPKGILPWRESRMSIKGRRCIYIQDCFKTGSEMYDMMKK